MKERTNEVTNDDLYEFLERINTSRIQSLPEVGGKLAYALAKNIDRLASEIKYVESVKKPSKEFGEYEKKRIEICEKLCDKKAMGRGVSYIVREGEQDKFDKAISKLKTEYREPYDAHDLQLEKFNALLDETIDKEFQFHKIRKKDISEEVLNKINGSQMLALLPMLHTKEWEEWFKGSK